MRSVNLLFFGVLLSAAACSGDKSGDTADATSTDSVPMATMKSPRDSMGRPTGRVRRELTTIRRLDGDPDSQLVSIELYTPPADFPVQFTTYKSGDTQVGSGRIGSNASVTFTPMFGAGTDPNTFIQVSFDTTALDSTDPAGAALKVMTADSTMRGMQTSDDSSYPWATAARTFRYTAGGKQISGTVIVGRRGSHSYWIFVKHPADLRSKVMPRAQLILDQWRWEDDYSYLVK